MKLQAIFAVLLILTLLCSCAPWQRGEVVVVQEDKVTIRILAGQSTSDAGCEETINTVLKEKFPDVEFQWTCVDWGNDFTPQMTAKFAAGEMPDIVIGKAQDVPVYAALGTILPIPQNACGGIDEASLELTTVGGVLYGLPYNTLYQGVLYNKSIFNSLGISVPSTREELAHVVEMCESSGITPFALHYGDTWSVGNLTMQFWMNDLFAQYPNFGYRADFLAEPLVADAFEQCRYMLRHSYTDAIQIDQAECIKRFAQGETAMFMTGTWSMQMLSQLSQDLDIGLFPYPNTTGDACLLKETNMTFMKGNTGNNSELVDEIFLELGTNVELAREIAEFSASSSTFKSLRDSADVFMEQVSAPYAEKGRIANVAVGNTQFIWAFQNAVAEHTLRWMGDKISLHDLLYQADSLFDMY